MSNIFSTRPYRLHIQPFFSQSNSHFGLSFQPRFNFTAMIYFTAFTSSSFKVEYPWLFILILGSFLLFFIPPPTSYSLLIFAAFALLPWFNSCLRNPVVITQSQCLFLPQSRIVPEQECPRDIIGEYRPTPSWVLVSPNLPLGLISLPRNNRLLTCYFTNLSKACNTV